MDWWVENPNLFDEKKTKYVTSSNSNDFIIPKLDLIYFLDLFARHDKGYMIR